MPIYRHHPALVLNTSFDVLATIKDESRAPSPTLLALQPSLISAIEQASCLLDPSTVALNATKTGSICAVPAPAVGLIASHPTSERDRAPASAGAPGQQQLDDASSLTPLSRLSPTNANALAILAHHDSSTPLFKTSRPTSAVSATTNATPLPAKSSTSSSDYPSFPSPIAHPKSRAQSDVSLLASRPTFPTWSTALPPTFANDQSPPQSPDFTHRQRDRSPEDINHQSSRTWSASTSSAATTVSSSSSFSAPDPYCDITRLRVTSRGNAFIYPGASFSGTQKSGRNNYDVTVTVVDVDFASNYLCGYLKISNLTEDYPELTTFFDAEVIGGPRHGFLTQTSSYASVSESEDMTHWGRFPAFRSIKQELKRPGLTIGEDVLRKKGVVFMRWKERFMVPDWKVKDINGASFAGFYYVCVEYGNGSPSSAPPPQSPSASRRRLSTGVHSPMCSSVPSPWDDVHQTSLDPRTAAVRASNRSNGKATMTGFYYHAESEPADLRYQQLSLEYDQPSAPKASFEFA